jgi:polysaccharide export outer membrane protein
MLCLASLATHADESGADVAQYRLQPGDTLLVAVWKEPDLSAEVVIRPDGRLSFPLAGDVSAADRSVEELRAELESRIRRFVPEAVLTVSVRALTGNRIFVIGKVARPGDFPLQRPIDVVQALALAGGATAFADVGNIRILRREQGRQTVLRFDYADVERGRRLEQNVLLQGGDTVVVP